MNRITVSIVSHGHGEILVNCLNSIFKFENPEKFEIILTLNIPEPDFIDQFKKFPIAIFYNDEPKGFGENHNLAFEKSNKNPYFCVLNPDIEFIEKIFDPLLVILESSNIAVTAPLILSPEKHPEDSVRKFPTVNFIIKKIFRLVERRSDYDKIKGIQEVDWIAGMFLLFKRIAFEKVNGFDMGFYLYYEDVDICRRLKDFNYKVIWNPECSCIHHARRDSHKNLKHLIWHIKSMIRYFSKKY